jgi:hypothetical protein
VPLDVVVDVGSTPAVEPGEGDFVQAPPASARRREEPRERSPRFDTAGA